MHSTRAIPSSPAHTYRSLFDVAIPKTINVSYQLPGGDSNISQVDPHDFALQRGMTEWTETILIDEPLSLTSQQNRSSGEIIDDEDLNFIMTRVQTNSPKLVISFMNETVGWGVFTRDAIGKSDYVSIYAGVQMSYDPYAKITHEQGEYIFDVCRDTDKAFAVNPKYYGNVSRFYQHMPIAGLMQPLLNNITFDDYEFNDPKEKANVATANLFAFSLIYKQASVIVFKAMRRIEKDEWLGFDYGDYWLNYQMHPLIFNRVGAIIDADSYHLTRWLFRTYIKDNYYVQASRTDLDIMRNCHSDQIYQFASEQNSGAIKVTTSDFKRAMEMTPKTSPYIFLDKPSEVNYIPTPQQPIAKPAEKSVKQVDYKKGFFDNQDKMIVEELSRITSAFSHVQWIYHQRKQTAYLQHDDAEVIKKIKAYLDQNACQTQSGVHGLTKQPLLYVKNPSVAALKAIESYQNKLSADNGCFPS